MNKQPTWWVRTICRIFHPVETKHKHLFTDIVTRERVAQYYCPTCKKHFMSTSERTSYRVYEEPEMLIQKQENG